MAALINALDNANNIRIGENGHAEYYWSNNIQEKILQFSFQLNRTDDEGLTRLSRLLSEMLTILKNTLKTNTSLPEREIAKAHLSILYRMIGHTRDIVDGKGEYTLSYMMVHTWYKFFPSLAQLALKCFVKLGNNEVHQYGSWKDLKFFCQYCVNQGDREDSYLIKYAINLINLQIADDYASMISNSDDISLAAKWAPREKSAFGWLYESLAINYFKEYISTANTEEKLRKAILKCKTDYRKLLSSLNKKIDTLQIKQCDRNWASINFDKVTSISLIKQKKAFLNIKKNGEARYPDSRDRTKCASNFTSHIQRTLDNSLEMKGKRVGIADFTKQALQLIGRNCTQIEKDLLNSQWRDNSSQNFGLGKMIAMVDVSSSMEGDPMYAAISLGIRIAEKSLLGKRVMTFSNKPTWVNLDSCKDFVSQVEMVRSAEWGMNTNFYAALNLILDAIVQNKMHPDDVQDLVLVILSDMQIDYGDNCDKRVLYDNIKFYYESAGIRVHGKPYKPPHILFWNLRSTSGFPSFSNQANVSMMSGFSPSILNLFCDQGMDSLMNCTPWTNLVRCLDNERYKIMTDNMNDYFAINSF